MSLIEYGLIFRGLATSAEARSPPRSLKKKRRHSISSDNMIRGENTVPGWTRGEG